MNKESTQESTELQHDLLDYLLIHGEEDDEKFDSKWFELNKNRIKQNNNYKKLRTSNLVNKDAKKLVDELLKSKGLLNPEKPEENLEELKRIHKLYSEKYKTYKAGATKPFSEEERRSEINRAIREMSFSNPQKLKKIMNYRKELKSWKDGHDLSQKLKAFVSDSDLTEILKNGPIPTKLKQFQNTLKSRKTNVNMINEQLDSILQSVLEVAPLVETLAKNIK